MVEERPEIWILLVEDDSDHVELARRVFGRQGAGPHVQIVSDGKDALDFVFGRGLYADQGFARALRLILLDLNLPKVPGLEVLRQLKADPRTAVIPVVIVTVSRKDPDLTLCFAMGVRDYIVKPMEYSRFVEIYDTYVLKGTKG